ncbi:MAG: MFS transporter, partial [Actinomycetota bacterium]
MAGLMVGLFLSSTEQSVVATALPTMAGELGGANRLAWVVSAYLLTSTIVTPLYGKMSDLYGRRIVYQTAIAVFLVGSVLCALAQTMNQLVAARAVQGLGGGGLMSLAFVIIGDVVSPRERGRYIGAFTAVFTVSAVTGPLWGGLLVDGPGWRWVFWSVVPIGLAALVVT